MTEKHTNDRRDRAETADTQPSFQQEDVAHTVKPVAAKPPGPLRDGLAIFGVLASAVALAFLLITFVFQSYQVDGPSMETTLDNNDHLIVWKLPKTLAGVAGHDYIPNRGDVIILNLPETARTTAQRLQLVKRVVGLPGDRVVVRDSTVTVYNQAHPDGFRPDKTLAYGGVIKQTPGNIDVTIRPGEVYVMGDHRDNSRDSRDFGPVAASDIVGKLAFRVLPLNSFKVF